MKKKQRPPQPKNPNSILELIRSTQKSNSSEAIRHKILQPPDRAWSTSEDSKKKMVTYSMRTKVFPAGLSIIRSLPEATLLKLDKISETRISVCHTTTSDRFESMSPGIFGEAFCYILDEKQGLVYLDKKDKMFFHTSMENLVGTAYTSSVEYKMEVETTEKKLLKKITLNFSLPYRMKYVLYVSDDDRYSQFAQKIFKTVVGCKDKMKKMNFDCVALAKEGVPVKGSLYIYNTLGKDELASEFEIEDLKIENYKAANFSIPKGFKDLRKTPRREYSNDYKGYSYGKPPRFSSIRPSRKKDGGTKDVGVSHAALDGAVISRSILQEGNLNFPRCFPSTYGSLIANVVDEKLLDDVRFLVNAVSKRLTGFKGISGNLNIDWLNQFEANSTALSPGPGSGLFTLIRDTTGSGLGLLDKLAQSEVSRMLVNGDVSSLTLPAGILTSVNAVIASTGILPADRFASLSAATQRALREAYLDQRIGNINLTYPDSTGTQTVFHGLLNVRLDNIDFDIDINNTPVLTSLNFDSDSINLSLSLPMASGKAFMSRWPTALYWAAVAISGIACLFLPFLCWLTPFALTVGVFILLDFAFVSISLSNIKLDAHIRFVPNAANVLQPDATLTFDADVNLSYSSVVPTGVHQILSALYSIVGSKTDIIVSVIESQLQDKLNTFVKQDLALTYPPAFGPVTLSGISNQVAFADMDNLYIEQGLNAGTLGVINPYITQVDSEIKNKLLILRNEFKVQFRDPVDRYNDPDVAANLLNWTNVDFKTVARYYLGTVISQNFLNHYIHTLWRNQAFNYDFSPPEASQLFDLLAAEVPGIDPGGIVSSHVHLFPAVSPRTVLTPKPASEGGHYSTTFFDDIRLCFEFISKGSKEKQLTIEFLFAAQAYSEIGFGSLNRATGKLDLLQINDRLFDIYFDLERIQVQVIHPEIQSMVRPDMPISVFLDYSALNNLQSMFKLAAQFALASRNNNSVPRLATDSIMTQRYDLAGKSFGLVMQLTPYRGNIYVNKGMSGVGTAIYEGALNIDTLDELTATLIRLFI